jgi:hypothetical protein
MRLALRELKAKTLINRPVLGMRQAPARVLLDEDLPRSVAAEGKLQYSIRKRQFERPS